MATTAGELVFIDANILIYSQLALSPFHGIAVARLGQLSATGIVCCLSRQIFREYICVLSRPSLVSGATPMADLVRDAKIFARNFRILEDGPQVTEKWLDLLLSSKTTGRQVHDANIAATMLAHGVRKLLAHNTSDFRRFEPLIEVLPLVEDPAVPVSRQEERTK